MRLSVEEGHVMCLKAQANANKSSLSWTVLSHSVHLRSRMNFDARDVFSKRTHGAGRQVGFQSAHLQPLDPRLAAHCVCVCV